MARDSKFRPSKLSGVAALFRGAGLAAKRLPEYDQSPTKTTARLTLHFEPDWALRTSIVDSAGSSLQNGGTGFASFLTDQSVTFRETALRQKRPSTENSAGGG
jgi:hypothetical protein